MSGLVIRSFYTPSYRQVYEENLRPTIYQNRHLFEVESVPSAGSWERNCSMKAGYIRRKYRDRHGPGLPHGDKALLWVDVDARIVGDLTPLDNLSHLYDVCVLQPTDDDRRRWPLVNSRTLSGTILLAPSRPAVLEMLDDWCVESARRPDELDQDVLGEVLRRRAKTLMVGYLPPEFCCIPDLMPDVANPAITHHQASRRMRGMDGI